MKRKTPLKRKTPMKRISETRKIALKTYSTLRRSFLAELPLCEVCARAKSTDVHHRKGRGKFYLDVESWLAVCRSCHDRIHSSPIWAREQGYLLEPSDHVKTNSKHKDDKAE